MIIVYNHKSSSHPPPSPSPPIYLTRFIPHCVTTIFFFPKARLKKKKFYSPFRGQRIFTLLNTLPQQYLFKVCGLLSKKIQNMHFWCYDDFWFLKCLGEGRVEGEGGAELHGYYEAASGRGDPNLQWMVLKQSFGALWWTFAELLIPPRKNVSPVANSFLFGKESDATK